MKIFKNYGCLAAEKRIKYTYGSEEPTATISEEIEIALPEGWEEAENGMGETILVAPNGEVHLPNDLISGNEFPHFQGFDKNGKAFRIRLKVIA